MARVIQGTDGSRIKLSGRVRHMNNDTRNLGLPGMMRAMDEAHF